MLNMTRNTLRVAYDYYIERLCIFQVTNYKNDHTYLT